MADTDQQDRLDAAGLALAEEDAGTGEATTEAESEEQDDLENGGGFYNDTPPNTQRRNRRKKGFFALGITGVLSLAAIIIIFIAMSSLKVIHFSEVLTGAGYARLNGIMNERNTQNLFDGALARGNGSLELADRSLWQKVRGIDPNRDLAALGSDGKFNFTFDGDGNVNGVQIENRRVTLDTVARDLGHGESYSDLGKISNFRERAQVRSKFVDSVKSVVSDNEAFSERYIRSAAFDTVAKNIGFDFSAWRQAARNFVGLSEVKAQTENLVEANQKVTEGKVPADTGIDIVDQTKDDLTNPDKIRKFLDDRGKPYPPELYEAAQKSFTANTQTATKVADVASKVGTATIVASMACMAHEAFSPDRLEEAARSNMDNAAREGLHVTAMGDQAKTGYGDAGGLSNAIGAGSVQLADAEASPAYQYQVNSNQTPTYPENFQAPRLEPGGASSTLTNIINAVTSPTFLASGGLTGVAKNIPGFGGLIGGATDQVDKQFCNALLSPEGLIAGVVAEVAVTTAIGVLTGPEAAVAKEEGGKGMATIIINELGKSVVSSARGVFSAKGMLTLGGMSLYALGLQYVSMAVSNQSFTGMEKGADYYERASIGTDVAQNQSIRTSLYGRPMTEQETLVADAASRQDLKDHWARQSVFARYFSIHNPYSITGSVVAQTPTSLLGISNTLRTGFMKIGSIFSLRTLSMPFSFVTKPALAAEANGYDPHYGMLQWGYSQDEINKMKTDEDFSLSGNEAYIKAHYNIADLDNKYQKCFTDASQYDANKRVKEDADCSVASLSTDEALHYRIYKGLDATSVEILTQDLANPTKDSASSGAQNSNIYVLGDSLTVGMRDSGSLNDKLTQKGWRKIDISALCGRHLKTDLSGPGCGGTGSSGPTPGGFTQVDQDQDIVKNAGVVVVGLGTNDPGDPAFEGNVSALIDKIKGLNPNTKIYWTNLYSTADSGSQYPAMNDILNRLASSKGFTVIDWASAAPDNYKPGNIHPFNYAALSDTVVNGVGQAP